MYLQATQMYLRAALGFLQTEARKIVRYPIICCDVSYRKGNRFHPAQKFWQIVHFVYLITIYLIVLLKMIYANIVKPSNWFASAQSNSGIHWPLWMCLEDVGPAFMSDNFPALGPHIQKWVLNERDSYLDFWLLTEFDIWKTSCLNLHLI